MLICSSNNDMFFCSFLANRQVLFVMADLHGMDPDTLADIVYRNTTKVFFPVEGE